MACYHPMHCAYQGTSIAGTPQYKILGSWTGVKNHPRDIQVPCGHCIGCRLDKSRAWADRMMLELDHSKTAVFVTLTYDNDHVPMSMINDDGVPYYTLDKRDAQLFLKRLRKHFDGKQIRYFLAGEYGDKTMRPHYHAIIFGLDLPDFCDRYNDPTQLPFPTRAEYNYQVNGPSDLLSGFKTYQNWTDGAGNPIGGGSGTAVAAPVSDQYDYYNAKLASIYQMDAETAYREALSNTSYQRAVEDLKAAGLNPVLAAGKVSGADTFYGTLDGGSGGSGGFSGGRSYSGASSAKHGLSAALKDYNVRSGVSSVVSGITTAVTKNFQAGAAAYYFSNAILNAVSKR